MRFVIIYLVAMFAAVGFHGVLASINPRGNAE